MDAQKMLEEIKKLVEEAKEILIVTHGKPTGDSVGSSLSLYLGLTSLGKNVTVLMPEPITVEYSNYIAADKLKQSIGTKNFVISLNYQEGSIEKVSYNIEGDKFNLVIEPRAGFETFNEKDVSYSSGGGQYDLIFTVDTVHLGGLGTLYEQNKELFASKTIINIDQHKDNTLYGKINVTEAQAATSAELVAVVLSSLGVKLSEDIASNLLNAVYDATDNFQLPSVNARTFEVASVCMKAKGVRFTATQGQTVVVPAKQTSVPSQGAPQNKPQEKNPPEEWLKPKIFKSGNIQ